MVHRWWSKNIIWPDCSQKCFAHGLEPWRGNIGLHGSRLLKVSKVKYPDWAARPLLCCTTGLGVGISLALHRHSPWSGGLRQQAWAFPTNSAQETSWTATASQSKRLKARPWRLSQNVLWRHAARREQGVCQTSASSWKKGSRLEQAVNLYKFQSGEQYTGHAYKICYDNQEARHSSDCCQADTPPLIDSALHTCESRKYTVRHHQRHAWEAYGQCLKWNENWNIIGQFLLLKVNHYGETNSLFW